MNSIQTKHKQFVFLLVVSALIISIYGCRKKPTQDTNKSDAKAEQSGDNRIIADKQLADFQIQLVKEAFEAASSIPVKTHLKDRSRAQNLVVDTCIKLDQPVRAIRYADKIENWRRGLCYANTAFHLAQNGFSGESVEKGLRIAEQIANMDHGRQWRSDRIKAKIAQTYILLGDRQKADLFSKGLVEVESSKILETKIKTDRHISFENYTRVLDSQIALMNFEVKIDAINAYAQLFNRYYDDIEKRDFIQEKIRTALEKNKLPNSVLMDVLLRLAEFALQHNDSTKAIELINEVQGFLINYQWPYEHLLPYTAKLAGLRHKAGDTEKAKKDIDDALVLFNTQRDNIKNLYRAETLFPLAEAYQIIGYPEEALWGYKQAFEESVINPNIQHQAVDFSATCCSMALHAVEPGTEFWARIRQIKEELGSP